MDAHCISLLVYTLVALVAVTACCLIVIWALVRRLSEQAEEIRALTPDEIVEL